VCEFFMPLDYKKLYEKICELYAKTEHFSYGHWDETFFTLRVFEICKELISKTRLKVNEEVILTAAILHDAGKIKLDTPEKIENDWDKHSIYGAEMARKILQEEHLNNEFIEKVIFLVKYHNIRPNKLDMIRPNELKILQDAELLADMGIADFIKPFLRTAISKKKTLDCVNFIRENQKDKANLLRKNKQSLNLRISKKIANKLIKESIELNNKIFKITNSELLE